MEMGGLDKGSRKVEQVKKAAPYLGAFLAGMLATHVMEGGKSGTEAPQMPKTERTMEANAPSQGVTGGYAEGSFDATYSTDSYDSYESAATPEALDAVKGLDTNLGSQFTATPEQLALINSIVDEYIAAHPLRIEEPVVVTGPDGAGSVSGGYSQDPLFDLGRAAAELSMNPQVRGLLLDELSKRMKAGAQ